MIKSGFLDTSRKPLFYVGSVGKDGDAVVQQLSDPVKHPSDAVADTGNQNENANDKRDGVLCFGVAYDAVNAADQPAKKELKKQFCNFGQIFVSLCHDAILSPTLCNEKTAVGADRRGDLLLIQYSIKVVFCQ